MKLFILFASLTMATLVGAQERVFPGAMAHLNMLAGQWLMKGGGWVEFHYTSNKAEMIGSAKPNRAGATWRRMMRIYAEGEPAKVRADFYDVSHHVIRYHLVSSDGGKILFANDPVAGAPLLELTYESGVRGRLEYRFEKDHKIVESGAMAPTVSLQPLRRPDSLIQPLSE